MFNPVNAEDGGLNWTRTTGAQLAVKPDSNPYYPTEGFDGEPSSKLKTKLHLFCSTFKMF
jgi:hypothetical protein